MKPRPFEFTHAQLLSQLAYEPNTGVFTWKTTGSGKTSMHPGTLTQGGYLVIVVLGKAYMAHRLAWFHFYGVPPTDRIDHIDNDKLNNRISNLREASSAQNSQNRKLTTQNKLGVKGVTSSRGRFKVHCSIAGKHTYIGSFDTLVEAAEAYKQAASNSYGEFARTK